MDKPIDRDMQRNVYESALACQQASNMSGLILGLAEHVLIIRQEADRLGEGTDYFNNHPAVRLYVEQMAHLSRGYDDTYEQAVAECEARRDNGYLLDVQEFVITIKVRTQMAEHVVADRAETFTNDCFLAKEYFGVDQTPAEEASVSVVKKDDMPKPFPPYKQSVKALNCRRNEVMVCTVDLILVHERGASSLNQRLAAYDLLMAALCDNEEVPGGPTKASMYVTEHGQGYAVRMECVDSADVRQAMMLCGFEEDNYLEY